MGESVDDFVKELQKQVIEETKAAYGDKAYHRWLNLVHMRSMKDPDGYACLRG